MNSPDMPDIGETVKCLHRAELLSFSQYFFRT